MNAISRNFTASDAVRGGDPLMVGIIAPSGGGKTWSALRVATGMQQVFGGDIYGIDTENGRMKHYADFFKFKHVPMTPPFSSLDYLAALKYCASKGSKITITDSMTHEHVGEDGYLETCEKVIDRIAGEDYAKRERAKFAGLAKAGPLRTKMIEGIKQLGGNFIFCWRAKQRVKPMKVNGKLEAVEMGLMPIGGEEWVYEMTVNCLLDARSDGVPRWNAERIGERLIMKLPEQFKTLFAEPKPLSEDIGRAMAEWARGGTAPTQSHGEPSSRASVIDLGNMAAQAGTAMLRQFWTNITKAEKVAAGGAAQLAAWKTIAESADAPDIDFDDGSAEDPDQSRPADGAAPEPAGGVPPSTAEATPQWLDRQTVDQARQGPLEGAAASPPGAAAPSDAEADRQARKAEIRKDGDARAAAGTAPLADFLEGLRKAGEADLVSSTLKAAWHDEAKAADAKGRKA